MKKTKIETANPNELSVSVNPGCFNLAENGERKSTFEISNNNGFSLYFRLMASNSHAMKFQPECGRLGPYGSVTVTGYHVQSARPIGLQQKVAIMTSRLPLEEWPDPEHYKPDAFSPPKKHRSPSKSFVPPSPSPHFDRYEHEIQRTTRRHEDTTRRHEDTTRRHEDTTRRHEDTTRRHEDTTRRHEDTTRRYEDTTRRYEDPVVSATGRQTVYTPPERRILTTIERPAVHTPERQSVPTIDRRQIVSTADRPTVPATDRWTTDQTTERRTMVSTTDRRTMVPTTEGRTMVSATERQTVPVIERRTMIPATERRMMVPITERQTEGLSYEYQDRHVKRREGGSKERADIRTRRIDIFCHCRNCKGSSLKIKEERKGENTRKWEIVKKTCQKHQGILSDDTDSIYQNTVTLELEQLPTSSTESYGSSLSSENSCLAEKFNTMIQECNKILKLTQYNFILILLLLFILILSSHNVVFSYIWPQPFCYKHHPLFAHYFGTM